MHEKEKRLFVANLPPDVKENEIQEQFNNYGKVVSVEIKHRKDGSMGNKSPTFAFVNLQIDERTLNRCFREFADYDWNGYQIKLELAKESFLERLKRERNEANHVKTQTAPVETIKTDYVPPVVDTSLYARTYHSSSSSDSSSSEESEEETEKVAPKKQIEKPKNDIDYVIKDNRFNFVNGKTLKIDRIGEKTASASTQEKKVEPKDKKAIEADERRKRSLALMKDSYRQQKFIIKSALSSVDTSKNNKIIFDEEIVEPSKLNKRKNVDGDFRQRIDLKKSKISLFDEDAESGVEDNDIDFGIKTQFEGEKGQKLLQLQSRFTNDKRFTLDSRFHDGNDEELENQLPEENEKQKQLEILESVLGHKITNRKPKANNDNKQIAKPQKSMLHFDPSKSQHSKYEIKQEKKTKVNVREEKEKIIEQPTVETSKEKLSRVSENLKESLKDNQPFSLLSAFGRAEEKDETQEQPYENSKVTSKINKQIGANHNPFRYDSSESEDEAQEKVTEKKGAALKSFKRETFFFQENDERLKEAFEFLERLGRGESEKPFDEKRRELKKIVRYKIKNNERNHRPFRKKLGRHKMIKVKKAKKN